VSYINVFWRTQNEFPFSVSSEKIKENDIASEELTRKDIGTDELKWVKCAMTISLAQLSAF